MSSNFSSRRFRSLFTSDELPEDAATPRGRLVNGLFNEPPTLSLPATTLTEPSTTASVAPTAVAHRQTSASSILSPSGSNSISGTVYNDLNHNGTQDAGEVGIAGRLVFLDANNNGVREPTEVTATTTASGMYTFSGLSAGDYIVAEVVPDWWRQTTPVTPGINYVQFDSDHGGPAYNWVDISSVGTAVSIFGSLDDYASNADLPFAFGFEGQTYNSLWIATNGMLTFSLDGATTWTNTALPNSTTPNALIAPFWDDLSVNSATQIRYYNDAANHRFIVEWQDVHKVGVTDSHLAFEVILDQNGTITYQYNSMSDTGSSATIGIENASGTAGNQFSYNASGAVHNGFAIQYLPRNPTSQYVAVQDGTPTGSLDFGTRDYTAESGGVSGHIWQDFNGDGVEQAGETRMAGRQVYLDLNNNGAFDTGEPNQITDASGNYRFINVDAGAYSLRVNMPKGWEHWYETSASGSTSNLHAASDGQSSSVLPSAGGINPVTPDFSAEHVAGQLVVKLKSSLSNIDASQVSALKALIGAQTLNSTKTLGIQLWSVSDPSLEHAAQVLIASGLVEYAEPNYIIRVDSVTPETSGSSSAPNDPAYGQTWGLQNSGQTGGTLDDDIRARQAWNITTGSSSVLVAVIDTGIDYNHPDLINNIWTNAGEIAGNGVDDDHNGYIDDVHGYDFVNHDGDPMDDNNHGTHCAGTIGAEGNNGIGVAGVNWDVSLMALKWIGADGSGTGFDAALAIEYATMMGVRITSNSWHVGDNIQGVRDALTAAQAAGVLCVFAAGNNGVNIDSSPNYPASFDLDNIISVAATDNMDRLASFSNYGVVGVDLAAPGVGIYSTIPNNSYASLDGTSMAAPHVAGVAALLLAAYPNLTYQELKAAILNGVDPVPSLAGVVAAGGRLNAYQSLLIAGANSLQSYAVTIPAGGSVLTQNIGLGGGGTPSADMIHGTAASDTIYAQGGNDLIYGNDGDDTIFGQDGNDILYGGEGNSGSGYETLDGGAGDDLLIGGGYADVLIGGDGNDTASYATAHSAVSAALDNGGNLGDAYGDTYDSIENFVGSAFNDVLIGSDGDNTLDGGLGNDYLLGEDGNDVIIAGGGNDRVNAGDGDDVVVMIGSMTAADAINGSAGFDIVELLGNYSGPNALVMNSATITNVEAILLGAGFNYTLTTADANVASGKQLWVDGSMLSAANVLSFDGSAETNGGFNLKGGAGNDTLTSGAGNNCLDGGAGNDLFRPGMGTDTIIGGEGNDTITFLGGRFEASDQINGGAGTDWVILSGGYTGASAIVLTAPMLSNVEGIQLLAGANYSITTADATVAAGQSLIVTASALAAANGLTFNGAAETDGAFVVNGGAGADTMNTGAGNDTLGGAAGNDTFRPGAGNDTVGGGDGNDVFIVTGNFNSVDRIDGGTGTDAIYLNGDYAGPKALTMNATTMVNMESLVVQSGFDYTVTTADATVASGQTLTVDASGLGVANSLIFNGGAETNGRFVITGGAGADIFTGGAGNDSISGNGGADAVSYQNATGGVTVDLSNAAAQSVGGGMGTDTLASIENITGSGFNDTLTGTTGDNVISAGAGNDTLRPRLGIDTVNAGDGDDTVNFSDGRFDAADRVDGGVGTDLVILNGDYAGPNAVVMTGTTLTNVEGVQLLAGFNYDLASADATVAAGQTLTVNASALGSGNGLVFNGSAETNGRFAITGGAGADLLIGGAGNDALTGGAGSDTVSYQYATAGVTVDLNAIVAQNVGGGMGSDTLSGIENVTGSAFNDVLAGTAADNVLCGGAGNDVIRPGTGTDTVNAGDGDDSISFSGGRFEAADKVDGGAGTDWVTLNGDYAAPNAVVMNATSLTNVEGVQLLAGYNYSLTTADATVAAGQAMTVTASALGAANILTFNGAAETNGKLTISGGAGADSIITGAGDDTINGGAGNDMIRSGLGADAITAGDGDDSISFTGGRFDAADKINGGAGTDWVSLNGDYTGPNAVVMNATTLTNVEGIQLLAGNNYNLTSADATVAAGQAMTVTASALGAGNSLIFNGAAETNGRFTLSGGAGVDTLIGGAGNDTLTGGMGADNLMGGAGADVFAYGSAGQSTGVSYDTLNDVDFGADSFDIPGGVGTVTGIDSAITSGSLSTSTFDVDLAAALIGLGGHHAILFTANAGTLSGQIFMVVDCNGTAGYQSSQDIVVRLNGYSGTLAAGAFR